MLKKTVSLLLAVSLVLGSSAIGVPVAGVDSSAEGEYAPLKIWFDKPASEMPYSGPSVKDQSVWESRALPIGNGHIGGMIFGGVENDRIIINEKSVWSGGPGKNPNYNEDIYKYNMPESSDYDSRFTYPRVRTKAETRAALAALQRILQDNATEFTNRTKNPSNPGNYNNITNQQQRELVSLLKGNKADFGSYQQLSDLYIRDNNSTTPVLETVTSTHTGQQSGDNNPWNLFDKDTGTKFYAGDASATPKPPNVPVTIEWKYNIPFAFESYSFTSANDDYGRDPYQWKLYGSNDGTDYVLIDSQNEFEFTVESPATPIEVGITGKKHNNRHVRKETKTFEASGTYQYFRLVIEATFSTSNNAPQLAEVTLNGVQGGKPYSTYERGLDLDKGVAYEKYTANGVTYEKEYFTSYPGNVMVIRMKASEPGKLNRTIEVGSPQPASNLTYTKSAVDKTITMTGRSSDQRANLPDTEKLIFAQQVKIVNTGGTVTAGTGNSLRVNGADEIIVLLSAGTNYQPCYDDSYDYFRDGIDTAALRAEVAARVDAAAAKSYTQLFSEHFADYDELFSRVKLDLCGAEFPDKTTEQLLDGYRDGSNTEAESRYLEVLYYQYGRYLLIGSSREGSLPANLQGIWAEGLAPPWAADYHTNINVQMNYWLAEQTNLAECHQPMIDYTKSLVPRGTETAQFFHQTKDGKDVRGWTTYHENNIWGYAVPAISGAFYCPTAAAWLSQDLWEQYAFSLDESVLEENYETMLGAALFWVDFLWEDERDGYLVANPSYSPEHGPLTLGASSEQQVIWQNFEDVIRAAEILGKADTPEIAEIREAQSRLWLPRIGVNGQYMEWKDETTQDITGDGGHRHVNHLFGLHPGNLIVAGRSDQDDQYVEAMKVTLNTRGDGGTGWSKGWKINFWARTRDGDRAGKMVGEILKESTYYNLFDAHPPFQIDGNFGATAGMTEMLLQSQGDSIDLLPALPAKWASGRVEGLKARGNFEIGMNWSGQVLDTATIKSLAGAECVVQYPKLSTATVKKSDGSTVAFTVVNENRISFATVKGETYTITVNDKNIGIGRQKQQKPEASYKLLGANLKNLYSDEVITATKAPADIYDDGIYVDYFEPASYLYTAGLRRYDIITKINGYLVTDVNKFKEIYELIPNGQDVKLKVWRTDKYVDVTFQKGSTAPTGFHFPGPITAVDWSASGNNTIQGRTGPQKNNCSEPGYSRNIGNVENGDWVQYNNVQFLTDADTFTMTMARPSGGSTIVTIYIDPSGTNPSSGAVATITAPSTAGWDSYQTFSFPLSQTVSAGTHNVYIRFSGSINITWISMEKAAAPAYNGPDVPAVIGNKYDYDYLQAWIDRSENKYTTAVLQSEAFAAYRTSFPAKLTEAKGLISSGSTNQTTICNVGNELKAMVVAMDSIYGKELMKDKLAELEAKNLVQGNYTSKSWSAYASALSAAQTLQNNPNATSAQLEDAVAKLDEAYNKLIRKGDKTGLTVLIDVVKNKTSSGYTAASWNIFSKALTAAQAIATAQNNDVDQITIDNAYRDLEVATKALKATGTVTVDKAALQEELAKKDTLTETDYTAESWSAYLEKWNAAKACDDDANATQGQVDAALAALITARQGLVPTGGVNKTALNEAIAAAKAIPDKQYAPGAKAAFDAALAAAEEAVEDATVTQPTVNSLAAALNQAKDQLWLLGDTNQDGQITTTDARMALQAAVGKITLTESQQDCANVNYSTDDQITTTDARLILQYAVQKIDTFPA